MSQNETRPETGTELIYSEDRCAIRWPLLVHAPLSLIALAGFGIAMNLPHLSGLGILLVVAALWATAIWLPLIYGLYVGIRIDTSGVQIGGIRARERRIRHHRWPPRKPFRVSGQSRAVFTCPWEGVRSLYLITDRGDFKHIRRDLKRFLKERQGTQTPVGMLQALGALPVQDKLPPEAIFQFRSG